MQYDSDVILCADSIEDQEAAGPQENGHAGDSEFDEEALPSTLFFGVRGQQVRTQALPTSLTCT